MKGLFLIISTFILATALGQNVENTKKNIDSIVANIDNAPSKASHHFSIHASKKLLHHITYKYQTKNKSLVKIYRQFSNKTDSTKQVFYIHNNQLIYASEIITSYFGNDTIVWAGSYYFSKGKLISHITLGHGKSETDDWDPKVEVINNYNASKKDIARYNKAKNR